MSSPWQQNIAHHESDQSFSPVLELEQTHHMGNDLSKWFYSFACKDKCIQYPLHILWVYAERGGWWWGGGGGPLGLYNPPLPKVRSPSSLSY